MTINYDHFWMPFTNNRAYKANPRVLVGAKGMYFQDNTGRDILDCTSGLWCVNAGHGHPKIAEAVTKQLAVLDYAPCFGMGHDKAFEAAEALANMAPAGFDRVFFTGSGSESADTALKIALSYHKARGEGQRSMFIGREKGYHGVNFGGTSVGGIGGNMKPFNNLLQHVEHMRSTYDLEHNAFSRGLPDYGSHFADDLENRIFALRDPKTVAAVIVEPMSGSAGVIVPPKGYLQRLRDICDRHGILLIFDEVITGFGRTGGDWATNTMGVKPDLITCAKGLTNGTVPMGAVLATKAIYDTVNAAAPETAIELPHGYTYSAHPLACAAAIATLDVYKSEGLFERSAQLSQQFEDAAHSLKGLPNVKDIRNIGLVAGVEFECKEGVVGRRASEISTKCWEAGILARVTGDTIAIAPPMVIKEEEIDRIFTTIGDVAKQLA